MTDLADIITGDETPFFAPVATDLVDGLIGEYESMRAQLEEVSDFMNGPKVEGVLYFFGKANDDDQKRLSERDLARAFNAEGAIAHLNAYFWDKAMRLTDVLDVMPQARRTSWQKQIVFPQGQKQRGCDKWLIEPIPEFTQENVRSTLTSLLTQRQTFFAERVDGIFRSLSKSHVTNTPEGFNKRMIIAGATNNWGRSDSSVSGVINDLRCIIGKFMGRDEPKHDATGPVIDYARQRTGEWISVDGGALRIRCYLVGTAHLEVHPEMAWRLNCVLAQLYPLAIPSQFRQRPAKRIKSFIMMDRPLPFAVLAALAKLDNAKDLNPDRSYRASTWLPVRGYYDLIEAGTNEVAKECDRILLSLGGAKVKPYRWAFPYNPLDTIKEIVASGCIPDHRSHQFYPTPECIGSIAVELADIGEEHRVLEPSAGVGGLADLLPKERTHCVEISVLHCTVLHDKGFEVTNADFLEWQGPPVDRIVMNPPFSQGRWQAHVEHAASMLNPNGRLVAILPASAKSTDIVDNMDRQWHGPYHNEFSGTSISVVILVADPK
jgi:hypothetical protein